MEPRICPKCRKKIPINEGFHFDGCNLICGTCHNIAFMGNIPEKDVTPATLEETECDTQKQTHSYA